MRNPLSVLFICKADSLSGAGHVIRCIDYAKELRGASCEVFFSGVFEIPWVIGLMHREGFAINQVNDVIYDLVVLDGYDHGYLIEEQKRHKFEKVIQFSDSYTHLLDVDGYLWFDDIKLWNYESSYNEKLLIGGLGLLMREGLLPKPLMREIAGDVFVVLGGSPTPELIDIVVKILILPTFRDISFHVLSDYVPLTSALHENIVFYKLGSDMNMILTKCDTVITSAGTSLWIQLSNLLPVGVISVVNNQKENYEFVTERGLAHGLGQVSETSTSLDSGCFERLFLDTYLRSQITTKARLFVDSGQFKDSIEVLKKFAAR